VFLAAPFLLFSQFETLATGPDLRSVPNSGGVSLRSLKKLPILLFSAVLLLSFQNCTRYAFLPLHGEFSLKSTDSTDGGNGGGYDGKPDATYYRYVPGFSCEGKSSYKDRLEVRGEALFLFENHLQTCATQSRPLSSADVLRSPLQQDSVSLNDFIYTKEARPADERFQPNSPAIEEVLCRDDFTQPQLEIITQFSESQNTTKTRVYTSTAGGGTVRMVEDLAAVRNYSGSHIEYNSFAGDLDFKVSLEQILPGTQRRFVGEVGAARGAVLSPLKAKKLVCITSLYTAPPEILPLSLASAIRVGDTVTMSSLTEHNGVLLAAATIAPDDADVFTWPLTFLSLPKPTLIGIYQSDDGGITWNELARVQSVPGSPSTNAKLLSAGGVIYVYGTNGTNEVFLSESTDGGRTWKTAMTYKIPVSTAIYVTGAALTNDNSIMISGYGFASSESTAFVRKCNRLTWTCSNSDEYTSSSGSSNRFTQVVRDSAGRLYTTSRYGPTQLVNGIYLKRSDDNGLTWTTLVNDNTGSRNVNVLAVSADGQMILYGGALGASTPYLRQSTDGGNSWISTTSVCAGWSVIDVVIAANKDALLRCFDYAGITPAGHTSLLTRKTASATAWTEILRESGTPGGVPYLRANGELLYFDSTQSSLRASTNLGSNWQNRSYPKSEESSFGDAQFFGLTENSKGHLYAAGYVAIASKTKNAVIYRSEDQGKSWALDYSLGIGNNSFKSIARSTVSESMIAAGVSNVSAWITYKSDPGNSAWKMVDNFTPASGAVAFLNQVVSGKNGKFWTVGGTFSYSPVFAKRWLVRASVDDGNSWVTTENYQYSSDISEAMAGTADVTSNSNDLYVAGYGNDSAGVSHWLIRKYSGGLVTLDDDDTFGTGTSGAVARGIWLASDGTLYAVGEYTLKLGSKHWVVKKKVKGGAWILVDDYALAAGADASANSVTEDAIGRIVVAGTAKDAKGLQYSIVRALTTSGGVTLDQYLNSSTTVGHSITTCGGTKLCLSGSYLDSNGMYRGFVRVLAP
jgi:hypothetical protein